MPLGLRLEGLSKTYQSPPPVASMGRGSMGGLPWGGAAARRKVEIKALDGVSLTVEPGEIFGLLGPNGAGKSTTIGILTTRVVASGGRAWVGDHEVGADPVAVKRVIGVVPQKPNLDFSLTAREILLFHGGYFGMPKPERVARAAELLERFQLADRADQLVRGFSGGMMQRLSVARALMHGPEVLFLDEPSVGLDPQTRLLLWQLIREIHERGRTIVLTTHNMEEADTLCERLAIVDHGRVIAEGTPKELKRTVPGGYVVSLHFDGEAPESLPAALAALPGVTEVRGNGTGQVDVYADRGGPLVPGLVGAANEAGARLLDLRVSAPSLENLFLHLTGRSLRD